MKRILYTMAGALLLALVPERVQAQAARLDVVVADSADQPVPGVRIAVSGVAAPATTDGAGAARVSGIQPGSRLVTIRHPGYQEERALIDFGAEASIGIRVVLSPTTVVLDTVTATGFVLALHQSGYYQRRQQGVGRFLTREDIARAERISGDLCPLFRGLPGFSVRESGVGMRCAIESSRGPVDLAAGTCTPSVRIDGIEAPMEQLIAVAPQHVEAIEAYASSTEAPAEFAGNSSFCGLILVWLRRA